MPTKYFTVAAILFWFSMPTSAQTQPSSREPASDSWKERGVALGINYSSHLFADIGHYRNYVNRMGVLEIFSTSLTYGSEFSYLNGLVVAPKVQARLHFYFFNASLAPILYTDFSTASLKLRPEMGIGNHRFDVNYGYNANLVNNDFTKLNRHMVSLRYYLMVRKRAHHTYDSEGVGIE